MLDKIIHFSLNNRLVVLVLAGLLLVTGMIYVLRTEVDIFPDLNAPTVVVMTEAPGFAPEEVEKTVTFPIETAVNGATGVRRVRSSSASGFSVVYVEFDWGTDIYRARQTVSEKLAEVEGKMPPGVGSPTLGPQSSILGEMMIIGLTSDSTTTQAQLRTIADRLVRPRLLSMGGVSQVAVIGGDVKEYQILLSPERMKSLDVSLREVMDAVQAINSNASGGVLYEYGNEYLVKGDIATADTGQLAASVVRSDERGIVTLADVADVAVGVKEPRLGVASVRTRPAVLLTVTKQPGAGTIKLTDKILADLEQLKPTLPPDVVISTDIFRQADFIDTSIDNLQESLLIGALFVVIVLFFFLMNLRTTLISLVALPLSIIVSILVLRWLGMTINTMSLGGIAIAIGSLVDDAIVDVENVYKRLHQRALMPAAQRPTVLKTVFDASREVRMPIFNSSLIIIASFAPLFFLSGIEGRMLIPLGVAFIVALVASTVVALTLTPVLCYYLLGHQEAHPHADPAYTRESWVSRKLRGAYERALRSSLRRRRAVLVATGALLAGAIAVFCTLGRSFLPGFNEGSFTINVSTLPGISLAESDRVGRLAEQIILSVPEVRTVARKTGRAELDEHALGVNVSEIEAPYVLDKGRTRHQVLADLRQKLKVIPGVSLEVGQPISHRIDAMLSGTEAQIAVKIFGPDLNQLFKLGNQVKGQISAIPGIVDVNVEQQMERPQLDIRPRRELLARYGIPVADFARLVSVALAGETVSQVYESSLPYDLTVRVADDRRDTQQKIANLLIDSNVGKIPLSNVAEIVSTTGPNTINRENVSRRIVVSANVAERDQRSAVDEIQQAVTRGVALPEGYRVEYSGQFESEAQASRTLLLTSLGALLVIFLLLYGEFKNVRQSLIILVNMPLAMIGGVFLLLVTSGELNIPAIIGFIALLGITTRNGMLLISRYNHLEADGVGLLQRIMQGSADRLNPILMTALTSALALIPLALTGDRPGNEIQSPLAIVILGGLVSATVLNVFVVPIIYYLTQRRHERKLRGAEE